MGRRKLPDTEREDEREVKRQKSNEIEDNFENVNCERPSESSKNDLRQLTVRIKRLSGMDKKEESRPEWNGSGEEEKHDDSTKHLKIKEPFECNFAFVANSTRFGDAPLQQAEQILSKEKSLDIWLLLLNQFKDKSLSSSSAQTSSPEEMRSYNSIETVETSSSSGELQDVGLDSNMCRHIEINGDALPAKPINSHQEMEELEEQLAYDEFRGRFIEALVRVGKGELCDSILKIGRRWPIMKIFDRLISKKHLCVYSYSRKVCEKQPFSKYERILQSIYQALVEIRSGDYAWEVYKQDLIVKVFKCAKTDMLRYEYETMSDKNRHMIE